MSKLQSVGDFLLEMQGLVRPVDVLLLRADRLAVAERVRAHCIRSVCHLVDVTHSQQADQCIAALDLTALIEGDEEEGG